MRKQIRRADTNSLTGWLPGFEPSAAFGGDDKPSFDVVVTVALANDTPPTLPLNNTPSVPRAEITDAQPHEEIPSLAQAEVQQSEREPGEPAESGESPAPVQFAPVLVTAPALATPAFTRWTGANFQFPTNFEFPNGTIERFRANIAAIEHVHDLANSASIASPTEHIALAKYSGWGGMSELFGSKNSNWQARCEQLRSLVSEEDFESARSSVLNAHYTDPRLIRWMYSAVQAMGFTGGRILDPSTGVGHFIGSMPEAMAKESSVTAVELDSVSSSIAKLLYPDTLVQHTPLEKANLPESNFDLVISNVPFGEYTVFDPAFRGSARLIHDYFFVKAASLVRPGGLIAFITSTGTMDKLAKNVRTKLRSNCDLVAAFRLPSNVFEKMANTTVTTDVIFLRRRLPGEIANDIEWMDTTRVEGKYGQDIVVNEYFATFPQHVIGTLTSEHRGNRTVTKVESEGDPIEALDDLLVHLPNVYSSQRASARTEAESPPAIALDVSLKANAFCVVDSVICRVDASGSTATPVAGIAGKAASRIAGMVRVRDAMKEALKTQVDNASDEVISAAITALNRRYDEFVRAHGILHDRLNRRAFKGDPDLPALLALEDFDEEEGTATKMPIFERRTIIPSKAPTTVETANDAFLVSLNWRGTVSPEFISGLLPNRSWDDISGELMVKGLAWLNPETQSWEPREVYLAGNVRKKLRAAKLAALTDKYFEAHVQALETIVPVDLAPNEISANFGAAWIPDEVVTEFVQELLATPHIQVKHSLASANWKVSFTSEASRLTVTSVQNTATWGTSRVTGMDLVNDALNQVTTTVYDEVDGHSILNEKESMLAREKLAEIKAHFREWAWTDEDRSTNLARLYNDEFNSVVLPQYDGSHLTFPGMSDAITPRGYQANVVWRYLCGGNLGIFHCVGAGKTAEAIMANMEARRLGIFKKILYVVPNHMLIQYTAEFLRIYPAANLLCASKDDLAGDRRRELLARIATGDWDGVIITQSSFEKLCLSPRHVTGFIDDEMSRLDEAIADAWADGDRSIAKRLEGVRKSVVAKLEKLSDSTTKDGHIFFDELGIDALVYDEAQAIKNLFYATKISRVAGLPNSVSRRALDAYSKIIYIQGKHGGNRGIMFTTATPIANSMAEMFTMQRYLSRDLLREHDLDSFDAWAATFGRIVSSMEVSPDGGGFRMNNRFAQFVNLPELMQMFGSIADVKTREEINLPVPAIEGGKPNVVIAKPSPVLRAHVSDLVRRAEAIRRGGVKPAEDNMLAVTGDGRRAALDMRLVDPFAEDDPGSKVNLAVQKVFAIWDATRSKKLTQLVFCDLSTPKSTGFSVYKDMRAKWVKLGVPDDEIAFIHDYDTDEQKASLFRRVRKGTVRILLGSTAKMGVGTNVQKLLCAIHHLDAPWRPDEVEQRDGRGLRPGNLNESIAIFRYVTESTFDAYMWQLLESKAHFIAQVMSPGCKVRSAEDVVVAALTYAEVKAIATGNPLFLKKAEIESSIARLGIKKRDFERSRDRARRELSYADKRMEAAKEDLAAAQADDALREQSAGKEFAVVLNGQMISDHKAADGMLRRVLSNAAHMIWPKVEEREIGSFHGFRLMVQGSPWNPPSLHLRGRKAHGINDVESLSIAMRNAVKRVREVVVDAELEVRQLQERFEALSVEAATKFPQQSSLDDLYVQQTDLYKALGLTSDQSYGADSGGTAEAEVIADAGEEVV